MNCFAATSLAGNLRSDWTATLYISSKTVTYTNSAFFDYDFSIVLKLTTNIEKSNLNLIELFFSPRYILQY